MKTVESPDGRTEVWAPREQVSGDVSRHDPWVNPAPVEDAPWIEPRNSGSIAYWSPVIGFAPDLGVVLGASRTSTGFAFRSVPNASQQTIGAGWAFGEMSGRFEYDGLVRRPAGRFAFGLHGVASGLERLNYFGGGNASSLIPAGEYRSPRRVVAISARAVAGSTPGLAFTLGPEVRFDQSGREDGTLLAAQEPYGTGDFGSVRLRATLEADSRTTNRLGLLAAARGGHSAAIASELPGNGARMVLSGFVAPAVWDVADEYGVVEGEVAGYVGTGSVQLAARVGGSRSFGPYPWFDAAWLGGRTNRGYRSHRFSGDGAAYGSVEVRSYFGEPRFQSIFPIRLGLVVFMDAGRVWLDGERSTQWHPSTGGGLLMRPVGTSITLRAVVAHSEEGTLFYAGSGFGF
jgi:hypothetical protein